VHCERANLSPLMPRRVFLLTGDEMQAIQAQSVALEQNHYDKPGTRHRILEDRDFRVVAAFVTIGLLVSIYLVLFCPWSEEISAALSTLS
jgi:type II secretory pathway component PulM